MRKVGYIHFEYDKYIDAYTVSRTFEEETHPTPGPGIRPTITDKLDALESTDPIGSAGFEITSDFPGGGASIEFKDTIRRYGLGRRPTYGFVIDTPTGPIPIGGL